MAVVVPYVRNPSWADGSGGGTPINAAKLNIIDDGILNAHLQPAVRVFHSVNQSITSATNTALAFDSERFDQAGGSGSTMHSAVTNNSRLTVLYAGIYLITAEVVFAPNATGSRYMWIRLNGSGTGTTTNLVQDYQAGSAVDNELSVTTIVSLNVNDYVEVMVSQASGGALNVLSSATYSPEFSMVRVA